MTKALVTIAACAAVLCTGTALATPAQRCQAAKNRAAGKYAVCRENAEARLARTGDTTAYNDAITRCQMRYQSAWQKAEQNALDAGGYCRTLGDQAAVQGTSDEFTDNVAQHLSGSPLADCPADLAACATELATCLSGQPLSQLLKTGQTTSFGGGSDGDLQNGDARRYTDNGDGTITDNNTGLMWEKKDKSNGIHDWNNVYSWGMGFTTFLAALNTPPCFAGYCDWRMPNVNELRSIVNYQQGNPAVGTAFNVNCIASCTVDGAGGTMVCSCTHPHTHWSSTTVHGSSTDDAWTVDFVLGSTAIFSKGNYREVRAVRGGV